MEKRSPDVLEVEKVNYHKINSFTVVRRNGEVAPLDIQKIRKVVEWACEGLDASPIELESRLTTKLVDRTTTKNIQENLIQASLELCDLNEPDWRYVAGRLEAWSFWKDVLVSRGFQYENYSQLVKSHVEKGIYDRRILEYSEEELNEASSWIVPERDKDYDFAGFILLRKRYLLKDELPQEALLTSALLLALPEKKEEKLFWARKIYDAVSLRKLSLATPMLANLRSPNGSVTSCFICAMDDNLESIFSEITNAARISKFGGGVGMNISRIRATGSDVMGRKNSSGGVIPWVKLLNDTAIAVNQGKLFCPSVA
jgi:ribonucleoside-diphosphate reductase alpha chain